MKLLILTFTGLACVGILGASYSLQSADNKFTEAVNDTSWLNEPTMKIELQPQEDGFWRITNDGVMGGKSTGDIRFEQNRGIFSGYISTENNGGFSSVYRPVSTPSNQTDTVFIDVEGDGQPYQLRLALNINGYRVNYKHEFETKKGVREQHVFNLNDFRATFRGRLILDAPKINAQRIREIGFLINKKDAGEFKLAVYSLSFMASREMQTVRTVKAVDVSSG